MEEIIVAIYYIFALVVAILVLKSYRKGTESAKKLGIAMLMNFLMIGTYTLNLTSGYLIIKSIGCSLTFTLMDLMLFFYYDYAMAFVGWENRTPKWIKIAFGAYIFIDGIFMMINPFDQVAVSYMHESFGDGYILTYVPQIPFHIHTAFDMMMIAATIILLSLKCGETPRVYRKRYYGPIIGMLLAVVINFVYLAGVIPIDMDPTILLYVFVGFLLYFYTFNYLPSVTLTITRNMILEYLKDPIILFDYEGRLADHSAGLDELMPGMEFKNGSLTIEEFMQKQKFMGMNGTDINQEFDWQTVENGKTKTYQCQFCCMKDNKGKLIGKLFVFHDVTASRQTYFELENSMLFDAVTGFYNKESFYTQIPQWRNQEFFPVSFAVCNVDGLRAMNEAYGTVYGDGVMRQIARYIRRRVGKDTFCAKLDNGDLVVVLEKTNNLDAGDIMEAIKAEIIDFYDKMPVSIEYGIATKEDADTPVEKLMQDARSNMMNKKMLKEKSASSSIVNSLKQTLCESDYQTEEHVERTRKMAARLGKEMGLPDAEIGKLELLAALHDIGKVAIPQDIIKKKGKLTPEERAIIEQHTVKGYRIAKSSPELGDIADGILCHHEKWDGTGYPNGLKGEEIPLIARVISAVDSHDVMVNDRPYHKAMPEKDAIAELRRCSGTQFDPHVVEVFTKMLEREDLPKQEMEALAASYTEAGTDERTGV